MLKSSFSYIICLPLIFAAAGCSSKTEPIPGAHSVRVFGGKEVLAYEDLVTMMASVTFEDVEDQSVTKNCTATFITPKFLLTAAYCVQKHDLNPESLRVARGLNASEANEFMKVRRTITHPEYGRTDDQMNDIAIIELEEEQQAVTSAKIDFDKPTRLASWGIVIAGYGSSSQDSNSTEGMGILRWVDSEAVYVDETLSYIKATNFDGKGVCRGDAGSAALIKEDFNYYIIGVLNSSQISSDDQCRTYSTFTNVLSTRLWINSIIYQ